MVSFVRTERALVPTELLSRLERPESSGKQQATRTKGASGVRDIVLDNGDGTIVRDVPLLYGICSLSKLKRLQTSHLQMRAIRNTLARRKCVSTHQLRHIFGALSASHPQVVPANIELVSVFARYTFFHQVNYEILKLTPSGEQPARGRWWQNSLGLVIPRMACDL